MDVYQCYALDITVNTVLRYMLQSDHVRQMYGSKD